MAENQTPSEYRDKLIANQQYKDRFIYPTAKIAIPSATNGVFGKEEYNLTIGNDADFQIQAITGTYKYTWSDPPPNEGDPDPLPTPHGTAENGDDDLAVRIIDANTNRSLTEGFCPLELILSPGAFGNPLRLVMPFTHIIKRNSYLRFEFVNYTNSPAEAEIALQGTKFFA